MLFFDVFLRDSHGLFVLLHLGKNRATVSKWVTNTMQPDARNLLRIAEALNIEAGRLLNQKHLYNEGNRYYPTDKVWRGQ